jgi:hypothetical protein
VRRRGLYSGAGRELRGGSRYWSIGAQMLDVLQERRKGGRLLSGSAPAAGLRTLLSGSPIGAPAINRHAPAAITAAAIDIDALADVAAYRTGLFVSIG